MGIAFHTPEEFFLGEESLPFERKVDPRDFITTINGEGSTLAVAAPPFAKTDSVDVVLLCGSPGAGKSTYYWAHLEPLGYERVNQDTLQSVSDRHRA